VGYKPFDTTLTVARDGAVEVTVPLEHLVVELAEMRVVARTGGFGRCTAPGAPDPATYPELAAVFEQLRQNAERFWLLADSYPAVFRMERRFGVPGRSPFGVLAERVDTLELRTDARWHYAPGRVVTEEPGARGGTDLQVNLPSLPDFADTAFIANHCFRLAGTDSVEHAEYLRLDFRAAERIKEADADGSALLDPHSYLVRYVRIRLTRPERVAGYLEDLRATVAFREIMPSLMVPDRISGVQTNFGRVGVADRVEEQRLVDFRFLHALPKQRP
jgi:hypothetical protein